MSEFFLAVVNMSISASWIVLAVLILRLLLKKAPKWIIVLLWGIVAVRLICPFSIESVMSLIPSAETINPEILVEQAPVIDPSIPVMDGGAENPAINGTNNGTDTPVVGEPVTPVPDTTPADPVQTAIPVLSVVWLAGIAGMLAYTVISYFRVKGKIGTAVRLRDNIFQSERVVSPFVLGLIKPKIYLPFCMDGQDMEYVMAHENAHIHRKDHWWKPIGFLILTIHWFNPLLWLGYVLLCRDIELACDEKVIKKLDLQQKANYSQALLNCSVNRRILAACPLAFGEVGIKERVKSVLSYKKPAFWIIVVAIVASIVTAICFLTDPVKEDTEQFFSEGFLFFDIGAESMESIESCTIIHDGNPTELILSEEDTLLFARYAYTDKVPVPELSEIFTYPKTKRIQIAIGDRIVTLYLMQDGCITVNLPEKGFSMYQAEDRDAITPEKYQQMIAKYTTLPDNTTEKFLKVDISSLPLDAAYAYADKQYKEDPLNHRLICDLQPETQQIIKIDGKYYQSYVASNVDIRYIWISRLEFPDNNTALWDWYAVGSSQVYSLDLLGKIDEGRVEEPDKIDVADMDLLSTLYNKSPFITQKGTTVYLNAYKPYYKHSEDKDYYEKENVFVPQEYTFVDLDKDGKKELIVSEAPYADTYLILREENKNIYGYSLPNRGFLALKQDGSFQGSGGALIHDYNTISFSQNTYQISTIAKFYFEADDKKPVSDKYGYAPDYEKSVFEINGKPVSFEEIEQFAEQWENRPGAVWMKLT